jgi:protein involved in polysaccharide export with SLBB domain
MATLLRVTTSAADSAGCLRAADRSLVATPRFTRLGDHRWFARACSILAVALVGLGWGRDGNLFARANAADPTAGAKGVRKPLPAHPKAPAAGRRPEVQRKAQRFDPRGAIPVAPGDFLPVATTNQIPPEWRAPPTARFTLGPGDVLDLEVLGMAGSRAQTLVGPDGRIYFFLLPGLSVWGLTLDQARELLERELRHYLQSQPQVSITLRRIGSKRIWILGRVNMPGVYALGTPTTVLEAVAQAGGSITTGATELADLRNSFLIRQGQMVPIDFHRLLREGDMSQNVYVEPDDFIYLPSATDQQVHVLGAVANTLPVSFRPHMTLMTAIAAAGGPGSGARLSQVAIVRGSLSDPKMALVNFADIVRGKAPDVRLEPRDIVYVPPARFQFLGQYLSIIVNSFIRTVAINEGVRAVQPDAEPIGITNVAR